MSIAAGPESSHPTKPMDLVKTDAITMNLTDKTIIHLSKVKVFLCMIGLFCFVPLGFWMLSLEQHDFRHIYSYRYSYLYRNLTFDHTIGILCIVLSGLTGIYLLWKIFDKEPVMILDQVGIFFNWGIASGSLITWSEIISVNIYALERQKILRIEVIDPQKYRPHWVKKLGDIVPFFAGGNPLMVNSFLLKKTSVPELLSLFNQYQEKYGPPRANDLHRELPHGVEVGPADGSLPPAASVGLEPLADRI